MANSPLKVSWEELSGACLFTVVGGYLDAYSYLAHGGVFANAQTGNFVLLAVDIVRAEWTKAPRHLITILTFSAGVLLVTLLNRHWNEQSARLRSWSAALEAGVLSLVLVFQSKLPDSFVVPMISFAAAVQITSFGSIGSLSFNSAMTTSNLRATVAALGRMLMGQQPEESRRDFLIMGAICLSFLLGALLGGSMTKQHPAHALLLPLFAIAVAAIFSRVPEPRA